jgi:structure-specific recognition protein 1
MKVLYSDRRVSRTGQPGIKANQKAIQGDLFMLEKFIFFVSKQPTLVELADVHQVVFSRVGSGMGASAARTFDLKVVTKSSPEYTFTSINKEEHEAIENFLKAKKVRVKNEMMQDVDLAAAAAIMDDDDDDEMQSVASSGEEAPRPRAGGDDDESEEGE